MPPPVVRLENGDPISGFCVVLGMGILPSTRADVSRMNRLHAEQEAIIRSQKERIDGLVDLLIRKNERIEWLEWQLHQERMAVRENTPPPL